MDKRQLTCNRVSVVNVKGAREFKEKGQNVLGLQTGGLSREAATLNNVCCLEFAGVVPFISELN